MVVHSLKTNLAHCSISILCNIYMVYLDLNSTHELSTHPDNYLGTAEVSLVSLLFFFFFFFCDRTLIVWFFKQALEKHYPGKWDLNPGALCGPKKLILPQRRSSSFVPPMCHDPTRLPFAGALQIFIRYRSADEAAMMQLARKPTFPSNQQHSPSATITFITAPFRPDPTTNPRGCKLATSLAINVGWVLTLRSRVA